MMVPNSAGGGYDVTARTAAKVMEDEGIASGVEVFNLEGAGGTVGLARTVNEKGNGDLAMLMGLGVVGASYTNETDATLNETTPLARLIEEPGAVWCPRTRRTRPSTTSSPPGRPTRRGSPSAAARRPAARTTCCRCSSRRPSGSTPRT